MEETTKTFIAYNTLNFSDINKDDTNGFEYVKIRYKIKENNLLAFIGRIKEIKALDILLGLSDRYRRCCCNYCRARN